jgi:hypothetical protein
MVEEAKRQLTENGRINPFIRSMHEGGDGEYHEFRLSWNAAEDSVRMLRQAEQLLIGVSALVAGYCTENLIMVAGGIVRDSSFTCYVASSGTGMTATVRFRRVGDTVQFRRAGGYTIIPDQRIDVFGSAFQEEKA